MESFHRRAFLFIFFFDKEKNTPLTSYENTKKNQRRTKTQNIIIHHAPELIEKPSCHTNARM